jgi:hypothetical protein
VPSSSEYVWQIKHGTWDILSAAIFLLISDQVGFNLFGDALPHPQNPDDLLLPGVPG